MTRASALLLALVVAVGSCSSQQQVPDAAAGEHGGRRPSDNNDANTTGIIALSQFLSVEEMSEGTRADLPVSVVQQQHAAADNNGDNNMDSAGSGGDEIGSTSVRKSQRIYVNCRIGSDSGSITDGGYGRSPGRPVRSLTRAIELLGDRRDSSTSGGEDGTASSTVTIIHVAGGVCPVAAPVVVDQSGIQIVGDGYTALSGGSVVTGWKPSDREEHAHTTDAASSSSSSRPRPPDAPPAAATTTVYVADIFDLQRRFELEEIKMLRLGPLSLRRGRWPKLTGDGLTTPNFMFSTDWTEGPMDDPPDEPDGRRYYYLGVDGTALPPGAANLTRRHHERLWSSSLVHVLGSGERDVNSQLVRVLSANIAGDYSDYASDFVGEEEDEEEKEDEEGNYDNSEGFEGGAGDDEYRSSDDIQLGIKFRDTLFPNQRFYFVNVDWGELAEGEYYHDIPNRKLYVRPPPHLVETLLTEGATAAVLDRILEVRSTSDVVVSNLTFLDTTFYSDGYWDGPAREPSDAAVRINYSRNVTVESCSFLESVGGYGVAIGNGTANSSVTGNLFDSMGLGGVALYGYDAKEEVDCPPPVEPLPERNSTSGGSSSSDEEAKKVAHIATDKVNYETTEVVVVSFTNPGGNSDDWIGVYPAGVEEDGTVPHPSTEWLYACGTQSCEEATTKGNVIFGSLSPGLYQAFIVMNVPPPYTVVQSSEPFAVVGTVGCPFAVNDTKPTWIDVGYNVMSDLGRNLVHVAGIALRAASHCRVHHNRISHATRYGLQADSFFVGSGAGDAGMNSRFNVFEYNVLVDTCRTTTDTGAIEMLGSGDPGVAGWYTANTVRFNNISQTVGSSSSDGEHVCVHGQPAGYWCRGLVWGIYLDGGQSGVTIFGNIIGATLRGAIFDNVGGNNTHENNILLGEVDVSSVLLDFGEPGVSASHPVERSISGSVVRRNIFYSRSDSSATAMLAAQAGPFLPELKKNGSDYNLFWSPALDLSSAPVFPGGADLLTWQGKTEEDPGPVTCSNTFGKAARLVVSSKCDWHWEYNLLDMKLLANASRDNSGVEKDYNGANTGAYSITLDCGDDWNYCSYSSLRICIDTRTDPEWTEWTGVDNQGWILNITDDGLIMPIASNESCLEVCYESGDVKGCNGDDGSIIQLTHCTGDVNQLFDLSDDGTLRSRLNGGNLCVSPPRRIPREGMDVSSIVADPQFVDPDAGNFDMPPESPAFKLGFKPIPRIDPPVGVCGVDTNISCLEMYLEKAASVSYEKSKRPLWNGGRSLWLRIGCSAVALLLGIIACIFCRPSRGIYGVLSGAEEA